MRPYDRLDAEEREAVDDAMRAVFETMKAAGLRLVNDDRAEVATDALATLVIESRGG